jgi:hypothetical protein
MSEQRIRKTEAIRSFDRLPLNALRVFEAVAIRLRFAAADALHVTPAAGHSPNVARRWEADASTRSDSEGSKLHNTSSEAFRSLHIGIRQ